MFICPRKVSASGLCDLLCLSFLFIDTAKLLNALQSPTLAVGYLGANDWSRL
jgi:hypothetical protein